jgi:cellulose biosynthesis protein BcsQ
MNKILRNYEQVLDGDLPLEMKPQFRSYAVSAFRGGTGKSTLAFNIAFELSRQRSLLVADVCPQRNLTETLLKGVVPKVDILRALWPEVLGPAFGDEIEDISYRISDTCSTFKGGSRAYAVPGSAELFAFPSALYQQLNQAASGSSREPIRRLLGSLGRVLEREATEKRCDLLLMDTSPFYAGATHLAWFAAEALVIPVRVDEHSIESLDLTLKMLTDPNGDFIKWNRRAEVERVPRVSAIVMTMVGAKSRVRSMPDQASRMFVERALRKAEQHPELFPHEEPADAFVLADDFMSSGRISGAESIPIAELEVGKFHTVDGKRLQVNKSVTRYKKELKHLASKL